MKTERWREIEQLYHAARERAPERSRPISSEKPAPIRTCAAKCESLLGCETPAEDFLEAPALEVTAEALAEGRARSMFGRVLGHYEIIAFLGAGGMGEVYRARDSRIGRDVAIKVLPPGIAAHPERLRLFEQEARAAGALNHPNILTIYDVGVRGWRALCGVRVTRGRDIARSLRKGAIVAA